MSLINFGRQPIDIKITLTEVQAQPTSRRQKHLLIDLTKFFTKVNSIPQLFNTKLKSNLSGTQRSTTPINLGSLSVGEDTMAAWFDLLGNGDAMDVVDAMDIDTVPADEVMYVASYSSVDLSDRIL
jgi:hypothetical protein